MEAPKCKLCGTRHWPRQGCPGSEVLTSPKPKPLKPSSAQVKLPKREPVMAIGLVAVADGPVGGIGPVSSVRKTFGTRAPNNTFDRKTYMREYMRQRNRRAKP